MKYLIHPLLVGGLLILSPLALKAEINLVHNGSFETGDFTDWTMSGNTEYGSYVYPNYDGFSPEQGSYFAALGALGSLDYLSQVIDTTPGQTYDLSYYFAVDGGHCNKDNEFSVTIGGDTVFDQKDISVQDYTQYNFEFTATDTDTDLTFGSRNDPGWFAFDNVSITATNSCTVAVPEPASTPLVALSIGLALLARRPIRRWLTLTRR